MQTVCWSLILILTVIQILLQVTISHSINCPAIIQRDENGLSLQCMYNGRIGDCSTAVGSGAVAYYSCKGRSSGSSGVHYMICQQSGEWSEFNLFKAYKCTPINNEVRSHCGVIPPVRSAPLIINGESAYPKDWPWHAVVYNDAQFSCGGSLISPSVVLTAGHCVVVHETDQVLPPYKVQITLGSSRNDFSNPGKNAQAFNVRKISLHPNYSPRPSSDIALVFLDQSVAVNKFVSPVCLPTGDSPLGRNWRVGELVGFGKTDPRGPSSRELRHASLPLVPPATCFARQGNYGSADFFCAGYDSHGDPSTPVKSFCSGDSGSGFVFKEDSQTGRAQHYSIEGIVSYNLIQNPCQTYGWFTKVRYFMPWIQSEINNFNSINPPGQRSKRFPFPPTYADPTYGTAG